MQLKRELIVVGTCLLVAACGGGGKSSKAARAAIGSPQKGVTTSVERDGTPGWVRRGSAAISSGGKKAFYGVGAAGGIRNPAMLRTTVDNRARAELAKVFETFSASLMKDYMASSGEQSVEQAIKTYTSMALKGVEIVDHYIHADGTMYALAQLDLARAAQAAQAERMGAVKSHTTKVDVDDIFEQHAKKEDPPKRAPVTAQAQSADAPAPSSATRGAKTKSGKQPAWVEGEDPRFAYQEWLCGVGFSANRGAAENAAYAALSRIFVARVESVSKDFMGAYTKTGAKPLEVQSTTNLTKVSTSKIFSDVRIPEVWRSKNGQVYALACLNRTKAGTVLEEQIAEVDERTRQHLAKAQSSDKAARVRELGHALDAVRERQVLNGELRIIHADGIGVRSEFSHVDIVAAFEAAVDALKVGVFANGPYTTDFRGALIDALTKRGYKVSDDQRDGMDVLVTATIRIEDGGKGTGRRINTHFARGVIQVEVKNVAQNKVLASINESRKEGHRSKNEAERRAVRNLAKKISKKVGSRIEQAMLR